MKYVFILSITILLNGCSSLGRSLTLGAGTGLSVGAASGALAIDSTDKVKPENVAIGAAVGIGAGLLMSYFLHEDQVKRKRSELGLPRQRIYFGDLPPNPFVFKDNNKAQ